jgi:hypothetical protein
MSKKRKIINEIAQNFPKLMRQEVSASERACVAVGLQLINFCVNGSPNEPTQPPIDSGLLRGSGSVFVNGKFITATPQVNGEGDPLKSLNVSLEAGRQKIDVVFNVPYAYWLHESSDWIPGGVKPSRAATNNPAITTNVGNKWVEKHLYADGEDLLILYGSQMKKNFFRGS